MITFVMILYYTCDIYCKKRLLEKNRIRDKNFNFLFIIFYSRTNAQKFVGLLHKLSKNSKSPFPLYPFELHRQHLRDTSRKPLWVDWMDEFLFFSHSHQRLF
jgi:hypothetical protein